MSSYIINEEKKLYYKGDLNVAIVGALGAVGNEMIKILEKSHFPIKNLVPMDVKEKAGETILFRGETLVVREAAKGMFKTVDYALFSAGGKASKILAPIAAKEGAVVIDNSSQWRMDPEVPLVVPEVNPDALKSHKGIIANPNCSTIQMLVALAPIHRKYKVKRVVVSTYQAVSGSGMQAIVELSKQSKDKLNGNTPNAEVYPHQIAFNALPHIDVFEKNGYTKEEMKMVHETHKILDPSIQVSPTAVRIPVFRSHSESLNIETEKPFEIEDIKNLLSKSPGVILMDDPVNSVYPLATEAEGRDEVFVGRVRRDTTAGNSLNIWVVADNLRKGAALNAVQIAETMYAQTLSKIVC
jgi:aspartate-semialdehyde dehydrogenase